MCIYIRYSMSIIEKVFKYEGNKISIIKIKDEIWFKARDVSLTLGYVNVSKSISDHVDPEDRIALSQLKKGVMKRNPLFNKNEQESTIFLNEAGLYSLVLQSKLPFAREFKRWIVKDVLPNIRKNGNYCLSNTKQCFSKQFCFKIMDERDLRIKVISYICNNHPNAILCAGLGGLQDSSTERIEAYKKGYMKGQFDITILNNHKKYNFLAVELKSPTGLGSLTSQQRNMADIYKLNNGQVLISNNYDEIILAIHEYFKDVSVLCSHCPRRFISPQSLRNHIEFFHKRA